MYGLLTTLPGLLMLTAAAPPAEEKPVPAKTAFDSTRDLEIQVRARQVLLADEELAPFNLGVTVRNGTAVVWGPISSPEMKARALKAIEDVRGVYKVKSEMYLSSTAEIAPPPANPRHLPDAPEQTSSAMPDWQTGKLPAFPGSFATKKLSEPTGPFKPVSLGAPIIVPDEVVSADLPSALERIRNSDDRYRLVRFDIQNGAIYLSGSARPENVMAFAQAISKTPGVERVVVRNSSNMR